MEAINSSQNHHNLEPMTVRETLEQVYRLDLTVHSLIEQIEALKALAARVKGQSRRGIQIPGVIQNQVEIQDQVHSPDPLQSQYMQIRSLELNLAEELRCLLALKVQIRELIATVRPPELRLVLVLRYLNLMTWEQIAERMNYSDRQILRLHEKALACLGEGSRELTQGHRGDAYQARPRNLPRRVGGDEL